MASNIDIPIPATKPILDLKKGFQHLCRDINNLSLLELKLFLETENKNSEGLIEVLRKRAKNLIPQNKALYQQQQQQQQPDYLLILDFECTCESPKPLGFKHEIIEFPILLFNTLTREIELEFHSYCRPIINPKLTKFCSEYTGITQDKVNGAPTFLELMPVVNKWVSENVIAKNVSFSFATDGPWDFAKFLFPQCKFSHLAYPGYAKEWVNVRKHFSRYYGIRGGISFMLESVGKKFIGKPHSGLDDARNLSVVVTQMLDDGACLFVNENIAVASIFFD